MRLIYLGMGGPLSSVPLRHLLQSGYRFSAVVIAAPRKEIAWRKLPQPGGTAHPLSLISPPHSVLQLAWEHEIPLYEAGDLQSVEAQRALRLLRPDVALVSCFAYRIPESMLRLPSHGFFNLHPSRLPAYRGPYPLFWQLRDGLREVGLTAHALDEGLDTGPIALQETAQLQDGMEAADIETLLGQRGGRMFDRLLQTLQRGELTLRAQKGNGSYQGRPGEGDFALDRRWSARRAYNFMRGTADWGRPYTLPIDGRRQQLHRALGFEPRGEQADPIVEGERALRIQFSPGILEAI
ncbi:MAG: methionyl-tRNA formyltransferase [Chloroflexota bacterium]